MGYVSFREGKKMVLSYPKFQEATLPSMEHNNLAATPSGRGVGSDDDVAGVCNA